MTACTQASLDIKEGLIGTTLEGIQRWILICYSGLWPARITLDQLILTPQQRAMVEQALLQEGSRLQLIRQSHHKQEIEFYLCVDGRLFRSTPDTQSLEPEAMVEIFTPMILVCTHGSRDRCCGTLGGAVYAKGAKSHPEIFWQTSHLGGHRFAPTLLTLPQGMMYGRVSLEDTEELHASLHNEYPFCVSKLRGVPSWPKSVQVAAAQVWSSHKLGVDTWKQVDDVVHVGTSKQTFSYRIRKEATGNKVLASCKDTKLKPTYRYLCTDISTD